jgi:hypothetical protein
MANVRFLSIAELKASTDEPTRWAKLKSMLCSKDYQSALYILLAADASTSSGALS